jgi:hypothetical protein
MTARVLVRRATAALMLAFVAACGSDNNTGPKGSFAVSTQSAPVALAAGSAGTSTITISRTGGFTGTVQLSIDALPEGVSAIISPATSLSNSSTSTIQYTIAPTATTGTKVIVIRGKSAGVADQISSFSLNVSALPRFDIVFPDITIPGEGSKTFKVAVNRLNGFNGVVDLQFTDLPVGVVGSFATISGPGTASGDTATLTLTSSPVSGTCTSTSPPSGTRTVHLRGYNAAKDTLKAVQLTIADAPSFNTIVTSGASGCAPRLVSPNSVQYTVALNRIAGFAQPITVFAVGLPAGLKADTVTTTGSTAVITVSAVDSTTLPSSTAIQLRATSAGLTNRNANATLAVTGLLRNNVVTPALAAGLNTARYFRVIVPTGATSLTISTATTTATAAGTDIDIAVRAGAFPDINARVFDCVAETGSSAETCTINNPTAGEYYVQIFGFTAYAGITTKAVIVTPTPPAP